MFSSIQKSTASSQIPAQIKQQIDAQWQLLQALASNALVGVEQVLALNIHTGRNTIAQSRDAASQLIQAKNPQEFFSRGSDLVKPGFDHFVAYSRKLTEIVGQTQTQALQLANKNLKETEHDVVKLLNQAEKQVSKVVDEVSYAVTDAVTDAVVEVITEVKEVGKKFLPKTKAEAKAASKPGKNSPAQMPTAPQVSAGKKKAATAKSKDKPISADISADKTVKPSKNVDKGNAASVKAASVKAAPAKAASVKAAPAKAASAKAAPAKAASAKAAPAKAAKVQAMQVSAPINAPANPPVSAPASVEPGPDAKPAAADLSAVVQPNKIEAANLPDSIKQDLSPEASTMQE